MRTFTAKERAKIYLKAAKAEAEKLHGAKDIIRYHLAGEVYEKKYPELFMCDELAYMPMADGKLKHDLRVLALLFAREMALNP